MFDSCWSEFGCRRRQGKIQRPVKHVPSELAKKIRTEAAKHALSFRGDQKQKSSWQQHVLCCVEGGREISNICDLLNIDGYKPSLAHIPHITLKKWAKEVVPNLKFKPGRPTYGEIHESLPILQPAPAWRR